LVVFDRLSTSAKGIQARHGAKLVRFGAVSAFNVVFGQGLLFAAQTVLEWSAVVSNVLAVSIGALPAYLLSRYWVWQKRGKNHFIGEVVPFWSLALLGFVLSTVAIWFVERQWDPHPLVINMTNLVAFGAVWISKFMILDRVLFKHAALTDETLDALVDEVVRRRSADV
jgi:putative flippase GtrA